MLNAQGREKPRLRIGMGCLAGRLAGCSLMLALLATLPRVGLAQRSGGASVFDGPAPAANGDVIPSPPEDAAPPAPAPDDAAPAASRSDEPALPAQAAAEKLIRNLFRDEYANTLPASRQALARKLLDQGKQTRDEPVLRYVCLREASDIAATAADPDLAMLAVDAIATYYTCDEFELRLKALQLASGSGWSAATYEAIANAGLKMIDAAVAADDYEKALRTTSLVESAGGRAGRADYLAHVKDVLRRMQALRVEYQKVKLALAALQKSPGSAADSTIVGRFYCLSKGDWEKGLPYLKKCSDATLVALAARDLAHPTETKEQVELADAWWSQSEKTAVLWRAQMQMRAGTWYQAALPQLTGLNETRVRARIREIERLSAGPASRIDLMILIDPAKDAVAGAWKFRDGSLLCDRVPRARLQLPYEPPEEYDFCIVFTRLEGSHDIAQILVSPEGTDFAWIMAVSSNLRCGFSLVDRMTAYNNATTVKLARSIENAQRHTSLVQVRRDGVRAYLDGEMISELATDYKNITPDVSFSTRDGKRLGIGAADSVTAFHAIEVMEISGKGKRTR